MTQLTPAQLASQIQELIGSAPPQGRGEYLPEMGRWAGRTVAVLKAHRGQPSTYTASLANDVTTTHRAVAIGKLLVELETALAEIELQWLASPSDDAAFAPGQTLDVFKRLTQTLDRAHQRLYIIDPYLDDVIVNDYLSGLRNPVNVDLLTSNNDSKCVSRLRAAGARLIGQHGTALQIRLSPGIHDRIIFIDDLRECVVMGSSIKDAGVRKPTYLATLDAQIAEEKRAVYDELWGKASPVNMAIAP